MIATHFEGTVHLRGHALDVVINYQYAPSDFSVIVGDCLTHRGRKSELLKKRITLDLPIFLEAQARRDFQDRMEIERDERIDRKEAA